MIGIDVGGTNLLVGVIEDGKVIQRHHEPIAAIGDFNAVAQQICTCINNVSGESTTSIGISVAGSVDAAAGLVLRAQNLDWDDAPLADVVSQHTGCHVRIENDVTAAAWGEFHFGAGRNCDSMFAVWVGTGIGGGLVLDNRIWRGPLGTGGEFGMGISEQNPNATTRVLEGFASRSGLQTLLESPNLTTADIATQYNTNASLTNALHDGASRLGTSVANVITLLSLDTVVFGGGIVEALGEEFVSQVRLQFDQDVFPTHCRKCTFSITELGPDAGLLGAALLAHQHSD